MNFTQYIAIRSILDYEIETNPDNEVLPKVVLVLLDSDEGDYEQYREKVNIVAASAAGGVAGAMLLGVFSTLLPVVPLASAVVAGSIASAYWLKNILKK